MFYYYNYDIIHKIYLEVVSEDSIFLSIYIEGSFLSDNFNLILTTCRTVYWIGVVLSSVSIVNNVV